MDVSVSDLSKLLAARDRDVLVIDVRRTPAFRDADVMLAGAIRRNPETIADWGPRLRQARDVVVYCVHGHEVSQNAAAALQSQGRNARYLAHGLDGWREAGGALDPKPAGAATRWVTRERPKIDRIACPWLIARFVDPEAEFRYVPTPEVRNVAKAERATPYDVPDVHFSHDGPKCSFDAFIAHYGLADQALTRLALIVRGADTGALELAPQSHGLLAVSLGLSRLCTDDHDMLRHGMVMYDALYAWCRDGQAETHGWNPEAMR
jgi:rhodanese-related sulfurtransferase